MSATTNRTPLPTGYGAVIEVPPGDLHALGEDGWVNLQDGREWNTIVLEILINSGGRVLWAGEDGPGPDYASGR